MSVSPRQDRTPKFAGLAPNLYYEVICVYVSQQVEVAPSLVTDCKKPLHQNRWFWGLGIGFFKSDANLRATFQNYFGERALCGENRVKIYLLFFTSETLDFESAQS